MRHILIFTLLFLCPFLSIADERVQKAEEAYSSMQYNAATTLLSQVADSLQQIGETPSADIYYNLGNAHYRQQQYTEASLNYLRALRIRPGFTHAHDNLQKAQLHMGLQDIESDEMFFIQWFRMLVNAYGVEGWTAFSIFFLLLGFLALAVYVLPQRIALRKAGFTVFVIALFGMAFCIVNASIQRYRYNHNMQAIISSPEVKVLTSPSPNSKEVITLREGQIFTILNDESEKNWIHISIPGTETEGWMTKKGFIKVVVDAPAQKEGTTK